MSLVRLNCSQFEIGEDQKELVAQIWPKLLTEKYPTLEEKIVDVDEIPEWVGDIRAISIKPLKRIQFVQPDPPKLTGQNINTPEIKEFIKTVNQIVMPGFDLLRYAAIQVRTDECTEQIQRELDDGWRIIAVLPQHGQRRPDYIMVKETR